MTPSQKKPSSFLPATPSAASRCSMPISIRKKKYLTNFLPKLEGKFGPAVIEKSANHHEYHDPEDHSAYQSAKTTDSQHGNPTEMKVIDAVDQVKRDLSDEDPAQATRDRHNRFETRADAFSIKTYQHTRGKNTCRHQPK